MDYLEFINHVKELRRNGKYSDVLMFIENHFEYSQMNARLCLIKATTILQLDEDDQYTLEDVGKLLHRAIELHPYYADALYEIGIFYMLYETDYDKSRKYLNKARELSQESIEDIDKEIADLDDFEMN